MEKINVDKMSLPSGWKWVKLGEVARFIDYRGKHPIKQVQELL